MRYIYLLVAVCMAMIFLEYHGPNLTFDDANYIKYANQILNGSFSYSESTYAYGYLLPYTIAISYLAFGNSALSASIPTMLEYIVLILLVYFISLRACKDADVAFSVAVIAATSTFIAGYSSRVLPDMLSGCILAFGVYQLMGDRRDNNAYITSGIAVGALAFVRLGSLAIAAPLFIVLALYRTTNYAMLFLAGVAIAVLFYLFTISFNISVFSSYLANQQSFGTSSISDNLLNMLILIFPFLFHPQYGSFWQVFPLGLFFDIALLGAALALVKHEHRYTVWAVLLVFCFIYILFGSDNITVYQNINVVSRYFIVLAGPAAVLAALLIKKFHRYVKRAYSSRGARIALAFIVVLSILIQLPMLYYFHAIAPSFTGAPI